MKRRIYIWSLLLLFLVAACETDLPLDENNDVISVTFVVEDGLAGFDEAYSTAYLDSVDYALVIVSSAEETRSHYLSVSNLSGSWKTESISLSPGSYAIEEFILFARAGEADTRKDDQMIAACAHADSEFGKLTDNTLAKSFHLTDGLNEEIALTLFRNDPLKDKYWWYWYGFVQFQPSIVWLKEALFFGDFCSEDFDIYAGSKYGNYPKLDMPAIFRIKVYTDEDQNGSYESLMQDLNNEEHYANAEDAAYVAPLSISLADTPDEEDFFKLDVFIYDFVGIDKTTGQRVFDYKYFDSWFGKDDGAILYADDSYRLNPAGVESFGPGQDGIFDFIVGPCTLIDWDMEVDDPDFETGSGEETAYAKAESGSVCFIESGFNRWGWTTQMLNQNGKKYELPIWAGAGQCDTSKGVLAGKVTVSVGRYNQATITYTVDPGYTLSETHLYTGIDPYPVSNGYYTVASGLFPNKHENLNTTTDRYTVTLPVGKFFMIAHAVVKN